MSDASLVSQTITVPSKEAQAIIFPLGLHSQHQPVKNSTEYIEGKKPRFAAASKKPLSAMRREVLLSEKMKQRRDTTAVIEFDKDKLTASINQMIMETSAVNDRGEEVIEDEDAVAVRQLKVAMKRLEEEKAEKERRRLEMADIL